MHKKRLKVQNTSGPLFLTHLVVPEVPQPLHYGLHLVLDVLLVRLLQPPHQHQVANAGGQRIAVQGVKVLLVLKVLQNEYSVLGVVG